MNNIYVNLSGSVVVCGALRHPSTTIARSISDSQMPVLRAYPIASRVDSTGAIAPME